MNYRIKIVYILTMATVVINKIFVILLYTFEYIFNFPQIFYSVFIWNLNYSMESKDEKSNLFLEEMRKELVSIIADG